MQWEQRNTQFQTLMLAATVMFGGGLGVIVQVCLETPESCARVACVPQLMIILSNVHHIEIRTFTGRLTPARGPTRDLRHPVLHLSGPRLRDALHLHHRLDGALKLRHRRQARPPPRLPLF